MHPLESAIFVILLTFESCFIDLSSRCLFFLFLFFLGMGQTLAKDAYEEQLKFIHQVGLVSRFCCGGRAECKEKARSALKCLKKGELDPAEACLEELKSIVSEDALRCWVNEAPKICGHRAIVDPEWIGECIALQPDEIVLDSKRVASSWFRCGAELDYLRSCEGPSKRECLREGLIQMRQCEARL